MANYTGTVCPVCKNRFTETDDIVVCPECGTPHHRTCWHENGGCANADKHGTDFVFQFQKVNQRPPQENKNQQPDSGICPFCGAENPAGAVFCIRCGRDITQNSTYNSYVTMGDNQGNFRQGYDFAVYGGVDPNEEIDGVKAHDLAAFIGKNSGYYLYHFSNMARTGRKISFSFSGFFLTPIYFFYRKMWGWGIVSTILNAIISLPSMVLNFLSMFNENAFYAIVDKFGANPINIMLMVFSILSMVYSAYFGLNVNNLYRKHATKKAKEIVGQNLPPEQKQQLLSKKGGTSYMIVIILGLLLIASYLLGFMSTMA